jgi:hypothetical protein
MFHANLLSLSNYRVRSALPSIDLRQRMTVAIAKGDDFGMGRPNGLPYCSRLIFLGRPVPTFPDQAPAPSDGISNFFFDKDWRRWWS